VVKGRCDVKSVFTVITVMMAITFSVSVLLTVRAHALTRQAEVLTAQVQSYPPLAAVHEIGGRVSVDLSECLASDVTLTHVCKIAHLHTLILDGTAVTDAGLKHLAAIQSLSVLRLRNVAITDAGLLHLHGLENLRLLDLRGTKVTEAGVKALLKKLKRLRVVR
jgi:hypothetical protein